MPRGWYPEALWNYTPLLTSAPTPDISSATDAPLICVHMSAALVPYIIGALELYRWRDKWQGSDAQVATALGVMQDLITILTEGDNCGGDMPTNFRFTSDCGLEYTNDSGTSWTAVPGWTDFATICFQGPAGATGAPGADGADGQPIELRTYFGTIQWRVVGASVWNHLINLSELTGAPGADGPAIELRTYFGTIQWRVVGASVWNHLIDLSELTGAAGADGASPEMRYESVNKAVQWRQDDGTPGWTTLYTLNDVCAACGDGTPVNPNPVTPGLLCAVSDRLAAEIHRVWDYAFTNPNNVISDFAGGVGTIAGVASLLFPGVGLGASATIAGFVGFISPVFSSETNSFTLATENYLADLIYCELTRRQQRTIDKGLLVDIAPGILNAPDLTDRQKTAVVSLILSSPIEVWALTAFATAPYPTGDACASTVCPDETEPYWCVQLFDSGVIYPESLAIHPLLSAGMVTINTGRLAIDFPESYAADSTYGYPFLPDFPDAHPQRELRLVVTFPRPTRLDRLEFEVLYRQTAATAAAQLLKVTSDDGTVLINRTLSGVNISSETEILSWYGDKTVTSLTITGQVWAGSLWSDDALLRVIAFKMQGQGYNPFKPLTNCTWEPAPSDEGDWSVLFDFTTGLHGWEQFASNAPNPAYGSQSSQGILNGQTGYQNHQYYQLRYYRQFNTEIAFQTADITWAFTPGSPQDTALAGPTFAELTNGQSGSSIQLGNSPHGLRTDRVVFSNSVALGIGVIIGAGVIPDNAGGATPGYALVTHVRIFGTGARPAMFSTLPD